MLDAALDLAAAGWQVLPCIPAGPKAKAPTLRNGFKGASTDPEQIREWWAGTPDALIGIVIPPHLLVLDIDPRNGGSLGALEEITGALPVTLTSWSGRGDGGRHLWFHKPAGTLSSRQLPAGVDLKIGGKGYTIAPPSLHPVTGRPYRWGSHPIAELPARARASLRPPQHRPAPAAQMRPQAGAEGLVSFVSKAVQGERNQRLFWAACRAFENDNEHIIQQLFDAAVHAGLPDQEAARTISSARNSIGGGAA